jgi:hypothetical protein
VGGTGFQAAEPAVRLCNIAREKAGLTTPLKVTLVDGDVVEPWMCSAGHKTDHNVAARITPIEFKLEGFNETARPCPTPECGLPMRDKLERQFTRADVGRPKAEIVKQRLATSFPTAVITAESRYIKPREEDGKIARPSWLADSKAAVLVLVLVDNNETRVLIQDLVEKHSTNYVLITAGNDMDSGQSTMSRREGKNRYPRLDEIDPEIREEGLGFPGDVRENCGAQYIEQTQTLLANYFAAGAALVLLQDACEGKAERNEIAFAIGGDEQKFFMRHFQREALTTV